MKQWSVAFRTGVGSAVGWGHLRRCLSLAEVLRAQEVTVHFAVDPDPVAVAVLEDAGFSASLEREPAGLSGALDNLERWGARVLVVDSYAIDELHLVQIKGPLVAVIDDLADRALPVDIVVNGAANAHELIYRTLPTTRLLLGPEYILLREEFTREPDRQLRSQITRVLVSVGGTDPLRLTSSLVMWVQEALGPVHVDVVIGPLFEPKYIRELERLAKGRTSSVHLHLNPSSMRDLMVSVDLAVTGGGQTTYELAATNTPAVAIRIADNQTGNLQGLAARGTLLWVGDATDDGLGTKVIHALRDLSRQSDRRTHMGATGRQVVDGYGARRVAQALINACHGAT